MSIYDNKEVVMNAMSTFKTMYRYIVAVCFFLSVLSCDKPISHFPEHVSLVENHSDILVPWIQLGINGAVVVNVDAHDDCIPISSEQLEKVKQLHTLKDTAAIKRANGAIDSCLYDLSNYITAAYALGIAKRVIWAVPLPCYLSKKYSHIPFRTCLIDSLALLKIRGPVILTVDADCIDQFANLRCINLVDAVKRIATTLRAIPWDIRHVSVSYSEFGGYLPITMRWVGNALKEALEGVDISGSDKPWTTLVKVEGWRRSLLPNEIVRKIRSIEIEQPANPWLQVYLADALFRADSIDAAYDAGVKAMRIDAGCCRILPDLASQLASQGRFDDADRYVNAAPHIVNSATELALAQGMERAGQIAKAIGHYSRINNQASNYSVDLLIGYGYERLGDTIKARQSYLHAVSLLKKPVSEMAGFADLTLAVAAAERFFCMDGDSTSAQILRKDHRLAIYYNTSDTIHE
jgi:tetratricopeptide (TPR) repeat protein